MTLEQYIREAHKRSLRINNLFERTDGLWQANLRSSHVGTVCFEWDVGVEPQDAMCKALEAADKKLEAKGLSKQVGLAVPEKQAAVTAQLDDDDDLIGGGPAPAAQRGRGSDRMKLRELRGAIRKVDGDVWGFIRMDEFGTGVDVALVKSKLLDSLGAVFPGATDETGLFLWTRKTDGKVFLTKETDRPWTLDQDSPSPAAAAADDEDLIG